MGRLRRLGIAIAGAVAWRLPGWPSRYLRDFRDAERGSYVDVLAACELTTRRDLRRKYFLHALDEVRHAALFSERARARGGDDRSRAAVEDAGTLQHHGIVQGRTLFERLGELEFLAFVHVAEADAVEQFEEYNRRAIPPADVRAVLTDILKDEHFHVSYSRAELERFRKQGRGGEVDAAVRRVRWRRFREGWIRFSRGLGTVMASAWLVAIYLLVVGPFRLLARAERPGWRPARAEPRAARAAARSAA